MCWSTKLFEIWGKKTPVNFITTAFSICNWVTIKSPIFQILSHIILLFDIAKVELSLIVESMRKKGIYQFYSFIAVSLFVSIYLRERKNPTDNNFGFSLILLIVKHIIRLFVPLNDDDVEKKNCVCARGSTFHLD